MEKEWCVYGDFLGLRSFGKIIQEQENSVWVRYWEDQQYGNTPWDPSFVKRFDKLEEAVEYYIKHRPPVDIRERDMTDNEIRYFARGKFPSYFTELE